MRQLSEQGCGKTVGHGHGDFAVCGKPYYNGVYICSECKLRGTAKKAADYRKLCIELLVAAKGYVPYMPISTIKENRHSSMVAASDKLKSAITKVEETLNETH